MSGKPWRSSCARTAWDVHVRWGARRVVSRHDVRASSVAGGVPKPGGVLLVVLLMFSTYKENKLLLTCPFSARVYIKTVF